MVLKLLALQVITIHKDRLLIVNNAELATIARAQSKKYSVQMAIIQVQELLHA